MSGVWSHRSHRPNARLHRRRAVVRPRRAEPARREPLTHRQEPLREAPVNTIGARGRQVFQVPLIRVGRFKTIRPSRHDTEGVRWAAQQGLAADKGRLVLVHTLLSADSPAGRLRFEAPVKVGPLQLKPSVGCASGGALRRRWSRAQDPQPATAAGCPVHGALSSRVRVKLERRKWAASAAVGASVLAADACWKLSLVPEGRASSSSGAWSWSPPGRLPPATATRTGAPLSVSASRGCRGFPASRQRQRGITECQARAGTQQGLAADKGRLVLVHTLLSADSPAGRLRFEAPVKVGPLQLKPSVLRAVGVEAVTGHPKPATSEHLKSGHFG